MSDADLIETLRAEGQEHLVSALEALSGTERQEFAGELAALDWDLLRQLRALTEKGGSPKAASLAPAPAIRKGGDSDEAARNQGEALLRDGRVAAFLVAGGQGSRLGFEGPKGMYPASPIRGRTLFQVFAAKLAAAGQRFGRAVPWYVMTSRSNHGDTLQYFQDQNWFGLGEENVRLFSQDMLPAMDEEGRLLLEAPGRLFLSPNGHGGSLLALRRSGALDDMQERGVEQIFYFQVDNPLAVMVDPIFVGHHDLAGAEMSTKVVAKRDAAEKVGVLGLVDGRYGVIEYSDLSEEEREARDENGELRFNAGNIAIHMLRRDFVASLTEGGLDLPWHLARKDIANVDPQTGEERRTKGIKFETFVFDALSQCSTSVVLEVDRREEFAPIKNAEGEDSPDTSRAAQVALFARWLDACGCRVPRDDAGRPVIRIDIDPRFADSAAALAAHDLSQLDMAGDLVLE